MFRKFQVREFNGLYSVVFNKDLKNGLEVYEYNDLIDLPYEEAVKHANDMELLYENNELIVDTNDEKIWTLVFNK